MMQLCGQCLERHSVHDSYVCEIIKSLKHNFDQVTRAIQEDIRDLEEKTKFNFTCISEMQQSVNRDTFYSHPFIKQQLDDRGQRISDLEKENARLRCEILALSQQVEQHKKISQASFKEQGCVNKLENWGGIEL